MLEEIVKDNLFVLEEVMEVYAKNPFRVPIPIKGKFGMTILIQEEGAFMLRSPDPKEMVFKTFKVRGKKVKNLPSGLIT